MEPSPGRSQTPLPRLGPHTGNGAAPPADAAARLPRLLLAHARAQALVLLRTPAQLLFLLAAPAVALLAVVAPQEQLAGDPDQSAQAVAQMAVLGGLAVSVFGLGINASEERTSPWFSHLRTLPVSGWVVTASRLLVTFVTVAGSMIPLAVVAWTATSLPEALPGGAGSVVALLVAAGLVVVGCVPFLGLALIIGYSFSPSTTVALTQVVVVPLAFAGGLLLPPATFAPWLEQISSFTPSRPVRDGVLAALVGEAPEGVWWLLAVWLVWSVATLAGAILAYARDEGTRFR